METFIITTLQPTLKGSPMEDEAFGSPSILITDHDEHGRQSLRQLLQAEGYHVTEARKGKEGLDACKQRCPDLVIVTIGSLDTDEIATCARLREIPECCHVPILVATSAGPDVIEEAFLAGADEVIHLPAEPVELRQRVRQMLRRQADEKHEAERKLLRTLIDMLPDPVYIRDTEDRFVLANPAAARLFGQATPEAIVGQSRYDLPLPAENWQQTALADDQKIYETGIPLVNRELGYTDSADHEHWFSITKVPLHDEHNRVIGLVGIDHDITALKQAEERLRQVVTSARCLLWYATVEEKNGNFKWNIRISNEEAAQQFLPLKIDPGQTYTDAWRASRFPEDRQKIKETGRRALKSGKPDYSQEFRCRRADGETSWLREDVVIKPLTPGWWSLVGVCTDITERKDAEQAMKLAYDEMEQRVTQRTLELSRANEVLKQHIVERERAEKAEHRRSVELETLWQAGLSLTASLELECVLKEIVKCTLRLINANNAHFFLYDGEKLTFGTGFREGEFQERPYAEPRPEGLTYSVAHSGKRIVVPDMSSHPLYSSCGWQGSIAGFPVKFGERVIGVITVAFENRPHEFDENELRALELLADQSAIAIQNVQYVQQIEAEMADRKRAEEAERDQRILAEALRDAAAELSGTLDTDEVMGRMLAYVARVVPHDAANVMLIESGYARVVHHRGRYDEGIGNLSFEIEKVANLRHVVETGEPFIIHDAWSYPAWIPRAEVAWIRSNLIAPVKLGGSVIGFLSLDRAQPNAFTDEHAERLMAFAAQAGVAVDNARLYQAVQNHAIELELRVAERTMELERERAQWQALLEAMGEGVTGVVSEGDNTVRFTNKALMALIGDDADEWDGNLLKYTDIPASEHAAFYAQVSEHIAQHGVWRGELKLHRKDDTQIDVSITSTAVKGVWGQVIGSVMIVRDISGQKTLQRQQEQFIANASHELRTPLTNLGTRLYLIRRQPERLLEHFTVMEMVMERMQSLIENMLDLSRFERGMITLHPERLVLQTLVNDVVRVQKPEAELKSIVITAEDSDASLEIMGDSGRLAQVITNIVTNAINYTPNGGRITIKIAADTVNANVAVVQVQDTGIGIAPELLPHIFKPFYRATEHAAGTGLGLSIAQEIMQLHKGAITVESQVGQGSTFSIKLPRLN